MLLHHGTTREWAQDIIDNGPNPHFTLPGVEGEPEGFFAALAGGPFPFGSPEDAARGKAQAFPTTGNAVIVEIEIPQNIWPDLVGEVGEEVEGKAVNRGGEIWFGIDFWESGKDYGADKLRTLWPQLKKRILPLEID